MSINGNIIITPIPLNIKICLTALILAFVFHLFSQVNEVGVVYRITKALTNVALAIVVFSILHIIWTT